MLRAIVGIVSLIFIGWIGVMLLPVLLPLIGYAIAGVVVLMIFAAIFG